MRSLIILAALFALPHPAAAQELASGKVAEMIDAGGYTYLRLEDGKASAWVATRPANFSKGQTLSFNGMPMTGFYSKTLKRKFAKIIFSDGPGGTGAGAMPAGHGMGGMPAGHGMGAMPAHGAAGTNPMGGYGSQPVQPGVKVEKASGPGAATVAEVFARRGELSGKTIVVRAKVVKVSTEIMGRNWVHLQDGTGDKAKATHDLLATTAEQPKVGDIVTVRGMAAKDKDFGSGYSYPVMLENAAFSR